ncbi:MAG TPA: polyprenyl synthetase family protein, partial [Candidatus Saccharimonadales bacterium]|nr:polyprenyl synthetase family protein [Candidatus Saccharimonadales bacterium]
MKVTEPGATLAMPQLNVVEAGVQQFAAELRDESADQHPHVQAAMDCYLGVLAAGGKRTRGLLTLCGYEMYGGDDPQMIASAAGVIEGLHASMLVIDDVADNAGTRRGKPSAHVAMDGFLQEQGADFDTAKLAGDMVITAALTAQNHGQSMLMRLDVPAEQKVRASVAMNRHLARTGLGQIMDLASTTTLFEDDDITRVAYLKTALYSVQMPLETGAYLASAHATPCEQLGEYAQHSGIAFQLHDDIMGTFGNEAEMGKSPKSDLVEGKQTLLVSYALSRANEAQRKILKHAIGNPGLSD